MLLKQRSRGLGLHTDSYQKFMRHLSGKIHERQGSLSYLSPDIWDTTYVSATNPPLQYSGEILLILDAEGRLVSFRSVPSEIQSSAGTELEPDWKAFSDEAGYDLSQWSPADPQWRPLFYAKTKAAWQGLIPNQPGIPVRIEAAALQGRPVSFEMKGPWNSETQMPPVQVKIMGAAWILLWSPTPSPKLAGPCPV
jgi:hypothetical protein